MEHLLTKSQFHKLFDGKDFVFYLKKSEDDYEYIYVNNTAEKFLGGNVAGKKISEEVSKRAFTVIIENYNLAIKSENQVDFEDYAYFNSEVRKYETTVRPILIDNDSYVLAITKEIAYDRDIDEKFLFMRTLLGNSFLTTVVISNEGEVYEANPQFMETFDLTIDKIKNKQFIDLPIIPTEERTRFREYLEQVSNGATSTTLPIKMYTLEKVERHYLATFSPILHDDDTVAIFLIMQDVTDYFEQQAQLRSTSHGLEVFKAALSSAAAIAVLDLNGTIMEVNNMFTELTRYSGEELIGKHYQLLEINYHPDEFVNQVVKTIRGGETWRGELCNRTKIGEHFWVDSTMIPLKNEFGEIEKILTINYNITDKKRILTELQNIERRFRLITENTNDLIVITNEDGIILYTSPSYSTYLGYDNVELLGQFYENFVDRMTINEWRSYLKNIHQQQDGKFELVLQTKDHSLLWTEANVTTVKDTNQENVSQIIMVSREISHRKELENNLLYMAYHDNLTQLPNRRYLINEFPKLLTEAKSNEDCIVLLYLDGDDFKEINDRYGHDLGDEFIRNFGMVLSKSVRSQDLIVRVGGDEFLILLNGVTREPVERESQITQIINRIRHELNIGWKIKDHYFSPTASIGVAFYPDHAENLDDLVDLADRALYQAKRYGKNNLFIVDKSI